MDQTPIQVVMRRAIVTARPDMTLQDAASIMQNHGFNGLPVVDDRYHVVGMLGIKDIVRVPFPSGAEVFISRATPLSRIAAQLRTLRMRDVMAGQPLRVHPTAS